MKALVIIVSLLALAICGWIGYDIGYQQATDDGMVREREMDATLQECREATASQRALLSDRYDAILDQQGRIERLAGERDAALWRLHWIEPFEREGRLVIAEGR